MFSSSIQNMMQGSSLKSAQQRVIQLESLITEQTKEAAPVRPTTSDDKNDKAVNLPAFSDYMKSASAQKLKYKVSELPALSKGQIQEMVKTAAQKHGVDDRLVMALIKQESNYNTAAVSKAGAMGLMQLMPATAQSLGVSNPFSPQQNIEGGVKHLKTLLEKYNGNLILALAAYNAGSGSVEKYGGVPPYKETQNYVKKVLENYLG